MILRSSIEGKGAMPNAGAAISLSLHLNATSGAFC